MTARRLSGDTRRRRTRLQYRKDSSAFLPGVRALAVQAGYHWQRGRSALWGKMSCGCGGRGIRDRKAFKMAALRTPSFLLILITNLSPPRQLFTSSSWLLHHPLLLFVFPTFP
jgi:hypothetical protein